MIVIFNVLLLARPKNPRRRTLSVPKKLMVLKNINTAKNYHRNIFE